MSDDDPIKAWALPSATAYRSSVLAAAVARALSREEQGGSRNRAYLHCRRWHRRWRSEMFISGDRPHLDCSRCGLRWTW